ncbi:MAG TPA: hypothetical protein VGP24_16645 [Glaciihabitans sp.]|jgi:hypothetical protein|nr:hypothetical protein [Glaciihabitans sp.]
MSDNATTPLPDFTETAAYPSAAEPTRGRPPLSVGTIVWGGILLLIAAITVTFALISPDDVSPITIIWSFVAIGGVLVVAGIVGAIVRSFAGPEKPSNSAQM